MGRFDYYRSGDWNAECDVCGQKYKASKLRKRWDGLMVCPKDFEFRHPQDFVRGVRDNQSTPFSRPEPPNVFQLPACIYGRGATVGFNTVGCAIVGMPSYVDSTLVFDEESALAGIAISGLAIVGRVYSLSPDF